MPNFHIPRAPGIGWRTTWFVGIVAFVVLAAISAWRSYPPLPKAVSLRIVFPKGEAGKIEPLISAGAFEAGDFLDVRYEGPATARFGYDYWGVGGPISEPFTYEPGKTYTLDVEMAALAQTSPFPMRPKAPLRVALDGRVLLQGEQPFHHRSPTDIYFAKNPIGGTTEGLEFLGELRTASGRLLFGGPAAYFSWDARIATWFKSPWHVLLVALASALLAIAGPWVIAWCNAQPVVTREITTHTTPRHGWFIGTAVACVLAFVWVLTGGSWTLDYADSFANFYDYQAASMLRGHLDVPEAALNGEAFIYNGKTYGYFGPTPAILRMPFALMGIGFGHLSRSYMLIEYIATLTGAYALLCHAFVLIGGPGKFPSRFATVAFTAAVGLGSTLFFLSSRVYIYHEAILCGAAFTVWSAYCALRFLGGPHTKWWIGALLFGVAAVHARPPIGFFALSLIGTVAAAHLLRVLRKPTRERARFFGIGVLAALGILSYNGASYLKFETIEGCPLRYNVQYSPERLGRIDGKQFHLSNLPFTFDAYFRKVTLGLGKDFPYFYMRGLDSRNYPGAKMDLTEPMAGVPYAMPALFGLALVAALGALTPGPARRAVVIVLIAGVPMTLAMFAAIAVSHRYTADFFGLFIALAALGLARVDLGADRWRKFARGGIGLLTAAAACITLSLTLNFQGTMVWGAPKETLEHYQQLRAQVERATGWLRKT